MSHGQMSELEGKFRPGQKLAGPCRKCGSTEHHYMRLWDSDCGGYEDEKHECRVSEGGCGHVWWVDGIDS